MATFHIHVFYNNYVLAKGDLIGISGKWSGNDRLFLALVPVEQEYLSKKKGS